MCVRVLAMGATAMVVCVPACTECRHASSNRGSNGCRMWREAKSPVTVVLVGHEILVATSLAVAIALVEPSWLKDGRSSRWPEFLRSADCAGRQTTQHVVRASTRWSKRVQTRASKLEHHATRASCGDDVRITSRQSAFDFACVRRVLPVNTAQA
jgi:hypothetical protein